MKYQKKFFEENGVEKVTVTATEESRVLWSSVEEETFEVVKKEEIYEMIRREKRIFLHRKFIKGFSLKEYREKYKLEEKENINIEKINISCSFLESNEKGEIDFSCINCENDISIVLTIFGLEDNCTHGKFDFSWLKVRNGEVGFNIIFDDSDVHFECCEFGEQNVYFTDSVFGEGNVYFTESDFGDGDCYFDNVDFGNGDIYFLAPIPQLVREPVRFGKGKVSFKNAKFGKGIVDFRNVIFSEGEVSFVETFFGDGIVSFAASKFGSSDVKFDHATFGEGNVSFKKAAFGGGDVSFRNTIFRKGDVDFSGVNFGEGDIDFEFATFGEEDVLFLDTVFKGENVSFRDAVFKKGNVCFRNANFGEGDVDLRSVNFGGGIVDFNWLKVQGDWDMRLVQADIIDLSGSLIHGTINFTGAKIKQLKLVDTQLTGKIFISSKELRLERRLKGQKDVINVQDTSHRERRDQFRLLKENFRSLGQYDDEDKAYIQFMEHEIIDAKEVEQGDSQKDRIRKRIIYGYKRVFFALIGKYGTSPRNVAVSMGIVWLAWSVFYFIGLRFGGLLKGQQTNFIELSLVREIGLSLYHSAVTFLTIGYGDVYPTGWLRILSGIEGFAGLFLMSYFTISFARKVLR